MGRKKSSCLAHVKEIISALALVIPEMEKEFEEIQADAEAYRELKPMLNKIASKTNATGNHDGGQETTGQQETGQETTGQATAKPGDLCKTCAEDKTSAQCGHDAAEACTGYKKVKQSRKKKGTANAENTNGQESNGNSGQ